MSLAIICDYEIDDRQYIVYKNLDTQKYHVDLTQAGETRTVQPNHDAEGIMRYLAHTVMGLAFKKS